MPTPKEQALRDEIVAKENLLREAYYQLLASLGAYDALKMMDADKKLPGYESCRKELEAIIDKLKPHRGYKKTPYSDMED